MKQYLKESNNMPFNFNFDNKLEDIKTVDVHPKGWKPVTIEYTVVQVNQYDTTLSVAWRVKGTTHTFTIPERRINVISHANYKAHFEEVLANFREDYLSWFEDPYYEDVKWKYEYKEQFDKFILPRGRENDDNN